MFPIHLVSSFATGSIPDLVVWLPGRLPTCIEDLDHLNPFYKVSHVEEKWRKRFSPIALMASSPEMRCWRSYRRR